MTPELADRLAKLLRMTTSSHDGEVLAACNRLNAIVAAHDLDWDHLLANGHGAALTEEKLSKVYWAGYERRRSEEPPAKPAADDWGPAGTARANEVGDQLQALEQILEAAALSEADGLLSDFDVEFSASMRGRILDFGRRCFISEKQFAVLCRLKQKLKRQGYI